MSKESGNRTQLANRGFGALGTALLAVLILTAGAARADEGEPPEQTHDGLVLVPESKMDLAYVKPGATFGEYKRLMILDAYVAFRKGWQRDQMRGSVHRITNRDMEKIKTDLSELFRDVFVEVLSANDGYAIVDDEDGDVLLLRPAIIDLDITAPDLDRSSRTRNFSASSGSATLYLELFDSVSSEILARVVDQKTARNPGDIMRYSNRSTNRAQAKKSLTSWANLLREALDEQLDKAE